MPWVWQTVCMAAVAAMDFGRSCMASAVLAGSSSGSALVHSASNSSIARFWNLLAEVSASGRLSHPTQILAAQPFFRFQSAWRVNRTP